MPHKSLRMPEDLWNRAVARGGERGFASTNEYIRFLIKEDLERQFGLEQVEASLVSSVSKVEARVTSLGTMHQATFAVLWSLVEVVLRSAPEAVPMDRKAHERLAQFRQTVSGQIRSDVLNLLLKGSTPHEKAATLTPGSEPLR